jgi:folate-binding protein YgfZ
MNSQWQAFLAGAGAELADGHVRSFGNAEREKRVATTGGILCDLSHFGLIRVSGEDARDFLQGQFSNDLQQVDAAHSQLSAYLSPKGRMLASFRIFAREDAFYLRLPHELVEPLIKRLRMFVLRARVQVEDAGDALLRIGCSGPNTADELAEVLGAAPETIDAVTHSGDLTVLRVPGPLPRFEVYGPLEPLRALWERLNVRAAPVGKAPWALLDILSGLPVIHAQTMEAFVPQMVNLELVDGVSFKKGCYPGQEVVARTQYLGKLKRRMYRLHAEQDQTPEPGVEIYEAGGTGEQSVGRIVEAQPHPDGGIDALAVLQIESAARGGLRLGTPDGPELVQRELPYAIAEEADGR